MDYHETTLNRYMEQIDKEQAQIDAKDLVLTELEWQYSSIIDVMSDEELETLISNIVESGVTVYEYMRTYNKENNNENN